MTVSSGDDVHVVLSDLIEWTQNNPEEEGFVKRALAALRHELRNSAAIVDIALEHSPAIDPDLSCVLRNRKKTESQEKVKAASAYGKELRTLLGLPHARLKQLVKMADEVGAKHGMFPSQIDKRSKSGILFWLKSKMDVLEADLKEYVSQHHFE
jgi:hypothetical protein